MSKNPITFTLEVTGGLCAAASVYILAVSVAALVDVNFALRLSFLFLN